MSIRKVSEVVAELAKPYDGPTDDKDGFTYIAWHEVVRKLDAVFGPTNWSAEPVSFTANPAAGLYTAAVKLTARAYDEETGEVVEFSRPGFSTSIAQATRDERENGLVVTKNLKIHETAADGAGSLALVKASKLLGDAFGLFLYGKKGAQKPLTTSKPNADPNAPVQRNQWGGIGYASEKRVAMMLNQGYTERQIAQMGKETVAAVCEAIIKKTELPVTPASPKAPKAKVSGPVKKGEPDDLDDFFAEN